MRIGTALTATGQTVPVLERDGALIALDVPPGVSLGDLIAAGSVAPPSTDAVVLPQARLTTPLRPRKIVAIGLNYLDHARETGMPAPNSPLVFAKFSTSVIGDGQSIIIDRRLTARVDWEVELAVVIGRTMRDVPTAHALAGPEAVAPGTGITVAGNTSACRYHSSTRRSVSGSKKCTPFRSTVRSIGIPSRGCD